MAADTGGCKVNHRRLFHGPSHRIRSTFTVKSADLKCRPPELFEKQT